MKGSELVLILLMSVGVLVLRVVTVPIKWLADLCFELAREMQEEPFVSDMDAERWEK